MRRSVGPWALGALARDLAWLRQVRELFVASPGAGSEWAQTIPGDTIWELLSVRFLFTTSAVVATRVPGLRVNDADGVNVARFPPGTTEAASLTQIYSFTAGYGANNASGAIGSMLPNPPPVLLPGWSVGTLTGNIDVGDAFTGIVLTFREWSEDVIDAFTGYIAEKLQNYPEYEREDAGYAG